MSLDKLPSVERLIQRLNTAEKSNQKEFRMSIQEARELITDLSLLTSRLGKTIENINSKLDKLTAESETITVKMDGGSF